MGRLYDLARVALSEVALNAALHGGARAINLRAGDGTVVIADSGSAFGLGDLLQGGYGGH
jgi:anti-sigma regulatory factor (Ser/Thr protein kinase)